METFIINHAHFFALLTYVYIVLTLGMFAYFFINLRNANKKDKSIIIKPLDRKQQELIRKEQDKATKRKFNSKLR